MRLEYGKRRELIIEELKKKPSSVTELLNVLKIKGLVRPSLYRDLRKMKVEEKIIGERLRVKEGELGVETEFFISHIEETLSKIIDDLSGGNYLVENYDDIKIILKEKYGVGNLSQEELENLVKEICRRKNIVLLKDTNLTNID